ncbi:DegT/DnrJ/EryC1/StrS family aminotransferase [Sphingomonas lycopersici]|uniref:DegT/DnrJ/EryC1/StrS family aminotransferase n=1 Tax=Sphingomonas lycopersici TaxID=2951807 RepID=A0AA41ZB23_9SPHN|nr:DegT/DnrJ/EryC1/StrS family aminotransferase [Sphingomonas lycopersici]MCW6537270.1 DegT/DnrJ/EryC1/StrS family aminotransferase [Sphingomonas lycopersici]
MENSLRLFDCRLGADARRALDAVLASGELTAGPFVGELEKRLNARYPGRTSVALSDMTQAIAMALRLAGIGPGDDVLTLALNCMSSNSAITLAGARPVWVDINPHTLTIDLADCARALTSRTKALVVYHVAGYPADIAAVEAFCRTHGIVLIEDANNALGARSEDRMAGSGGRFSILSFYANRQVNAIEGAALLCADPADAERARRLRRFGVDVARFRDADGEIAADTDVIEVGVPASMTNVNACLACHQFEQLEVRLQRTRANALALRDALSGTRVTPVQWREQDSPAFWAFVVRCGDRDGLMRMLKSHGIQCSKLHQRNDRYSGFEAATRDLPGTSALERDMLAIPAGWWLDSAQRMRMVRLLQAWRPSYDSGQALYVAARDGPLS